MKTTSLFIEFLIMGFLFLMIILFTLLLMLQIHDLDFFISINNYWSIITFFSLVFSYMFGAVLHRLLHKFLQNIILKNSKSKYEGGNWFDDYYRVYNYGSDNIIKRIEYYQNLRKLFVSIAFLSPILGITGGLWLYKSFEKCIGLTFALTFIIVGFLAFRAYRIQDKSFTKAIFESVKFTRNKSIDKEMDDNEIKKNKSK